VVDRYTRYTTIRKLANKKHQSVTSGLVSMLSNVNVKTLTFDNDISFSHWSMLEQILHTTIYFTHPYCSWEKGLVENTNRWIRLFVPKKKDIGLVTEEDIDDALRYLNDIPRQCLGYKTTTEMVALTKQVS